LFVCQPKRERALASNSVCPVLQMLTLVKVNCWLFAHLGLLTQSVRVTVTKTRFKILPAKVSDLFNSSWFFFFFEMSKSFIPNKCKINTYISNLNNIMNWM
jgi:hypothetical protein